MTKPVAVLFDVGNVIVRWHPRTLYSKILPDPAERDRFLAEVCTMAWHTEHDRGVPMAENARALIARFPQYEEAILAWDRRWDEMFSGVIEETVQVIEDLHAEGVQLYGLTNMPAEKAEAIFAMTPAFQRFDDIVVSAVERVVKPDARAFQIACERAGRTPAEMVFIDDSPANVEAAAALGLDAILFDDPVALRPQLVDRGLLPR
jgi:2-haloacid dehalogenase/putative hydrolase of the HAD superfamily